MQSPFYYGLDDVPPLWQTLIYGMQWAVIMAPALVIVASIASEALQLWPEDRVAFFQKTLILSGGFTLLQATVGHRYPIQEGPAVALLLTFVVLAPQGVAVIQGAFLSGGLLLFGAGRLGWMARIAGLFTPNVVGVILMLIAFTMVPFLLPRIVGMSPDQPRGEPAVLVVSLLLILFIATLSYRLRGFPQTVAMVVGIGVGSLGYWVWGRVDLEPVGQASWVGLSGDLWAGRPRFSFPAVLSGVLAYVAVTVNAVGSMQGVAGIVGAEGIGPRMDRGLAMTGLSGLVASGLGVVGTVGYSTSPGVILVTRVASRRALAMCGGILMATGIASRLGALLAAIPAAVVGAALAVALASQVGAAIGTVTAGGRRLTGRDYLVVGLPVLLGSVVAALPTAFFAAFPAGLGNLVGNGLILGILLVLLLEHALLRAKTSPAQDAGSSVSASADARLDKKPLQP
jgi:uracil permease